MVVYRGKNYEGPPSEPLLSTDTASVNGASAGAENASQMLPQEHHKNLTAEEVDGDLLPQTILDFKPPLRLLPAGMRLGLTNADLTHLRKLAKSLPCHFALGRNRHHQGLAAAIIKLWEKSSVAKIAVKRDIQNTNNKLMSEE